MVKLLKTEHDLPSYIDPCDTLVLYPTQCYGLQQTEQVSSLNTEVTAEVKQWYKISGGIKSKKTLFLSSMKDISGIILREDNELYQLKFEDNS